MSNFQIPVVNQAQVVSSSQSLTGCLYQVIQSPGPQGKNVLNLIPVLNSKDNVSPVVATSAIPNAGTLNLQQPIRLSLPSAVSNVSVPYQVNSPLVQQLGTGKYIITTQKSPTETSKTIRVNNPFSPPLSTAVVLENSGLMLPSLPSTSKPGTQRIIMMNTKSPSVPVKTIPFLPSGHGLQIPAHAEVKTVPASSLPFSIQQRILPQLNCNDTTKIPSVVYVSPVNTIKTSSDQVHTMPSKPSSSITILKSNTVIPTLAPASQPSKTESPKGPMKWVVQEGAESSPCIVPVTSSSNTASKLLKMMTGTKAEDINLSNTSNSKIVQIKDNALVVCNNKIYLLTKQGAELRGMDNVKAEPTSDTCISVVQKKDPPIKPTEAAVFKNVSPPTPPKQTVAPSKAVTSSPVLPSAVNSRTCAPSKTNANEPEVIYIDDDDDDLDTIQKPPPPLYNQPDKMSLVKPDTPQPPVVYSSSRKEPTQTWPNKTSYINLCTPSPPLDSGSKRKDDQLHNTPNPACFIKACSTTAPLDSGSKRRDDQIYNQSNSSSIKVCSTSDFESKRKDNQLHNQPIPTGFDKVCSTTAPLDSGSKRKDDQLYSQPNRTSSTAAPLGYGATDDQVEANEEGCTRILEGSVKSLSEDRRLRAKFGLVKKEKIVLNRIPLLRLESASNSRSSSSPSGSSHPREDVEARAESPTKRKFSEEETFSKRKKSLDPECNKSTVERNCLASTSAIPVTAGASHVTQTCAPSGLDADPSDSGSYYFGQDITGHFSDAPAPSPRFFLENSAYSDETTKDEKIQRLKEVLKEREQALEALRRMKRP